MKKVGYALAIGIAWLGAGLGPAARAADLPTKKETPAPPKVNCFASFWTYLNSTAAECPLTYGPSILYATIDAGFGYNTNGANWNPSYANGVASGISKQSYGPKWQQVPNGINQSVLGLKLSQPIGWGWSIVGTVETAADPYSLWIANGQRSQVMNNGKGLLQQNYNSNSSRSGQWDNSQGFVGLSNKTYGTLVFGRVNSLGLDGLVGYDPMGSAYAFSAFGFSGQYAGFGDTEIGRANTGLKYRGEFANFRVAGSRRSRLQPGQRRDPSMAGPGWRGLRHLRRQAFARRDRQLRRERSQHVDLHRSLLSHQIGRVQGPGRMHLGYPEILRHRRSQGDAVEQHRNVAARQVQVAANSIDDLRRLGLVAAGQPKR